MFSANGSWLSNFARGRSSGSAIGALLRLPGRCPVTHMEQNSRLTATSSRRICTCFPFHPSAALPPRTPWTLCSLVDIITHLPPAVKTELAEKFYKNPLQIGEKRVSYSGILQNANETGRCRGKRTESRRRVQFRTGGAARDHLSSGCAEERVGADGRPRYGAMKWAWARLFRLDGGRLCQFGWYREQPRPNGMKAAFNYFRK